MNRTVIFLKILSSSSVKTTRITGNYRKTRENYSMNQRVTQSYNRDGGLGETAMLTLYITLCFDVKELTTWRSLLLRVTLNARSLKVMGRLLLKFKI